MDIKVAQNKIIQLSKKIDKIQYNILPILSYTIVFDVILSDDVFNFLTH